MKVYTIGQGLKRLLFVLYYVTLCPLYGVPPCPTTNYLNDNEVVTGMCVKQARRANGFRTRKKLGKIHVTHFIE